MLYFGINRMKSRARNIVRIPFSLCPFRAKRKYTFNMARRTRLIEQGSAFINVIICNSTLRNEDKLLCSRFNLSETQFISLSLSS